MNGTMISLSVRPLLISEVDAAYAMNQAEVPHVGDVSRDRFIEIIAHSATALCAEVDGQLVGFVLAMGPTSPYDSPNYGWFAARHDAFTYIDRVVVAPQARHRGVARALYDAVLEDEPQPLLTAEVNIEPPNPASMAFHERYGFAEVGRVEPGPGKIVAMLAYPTGLKRPEPGPDPPDLILPT